MSSSLDNYSEDIQERLKRGMGCWSEWLPGWAPLIEALNGRLAEIDPDYVIDQIKQKFGTLRFDISRPWLDSCGWSDQEYKEWYDLVEQFEGYSALVCMECGMPGKIGPVFPDGHYILCLCDDCRVERQNV